MVPSDEASDAGLKATAIDTPYDRLCKICGQPIHPRAAGRLAAHTDGQGGVRSREHAAAPQRREPPLAEEETRGSTSMTNQISKKFAASCVAEWSGTTGYPTTREGLLCLIDTFYKVSKSESHARQIVEDLQADSIYCPRPAEIRRVAISIQPDSNENHRLLEVRQHRLSRWSDPSTAT